MTLVRVSLSIRWKSVLVLGGILVLALPLQVRAQEDPDDTPLGDVARSFRVKPAPSDLVIDNDNLSKVVDDAEKRRATGSTMVFSLDPGGKSFNVSSPDVSCSLSFSAKTSSLLSDPVALNELPQSELAKLDGPAVIDGDSIEVSVHNGSSWELREVVIGLTIIRRPEPGEATSYYGRARIVPAVAGVSSHAGQDSSQKLPDITMLLRVKGSAGPSATALFRTQLNFSLFPDQEWHWAIVKAKGVPPLPPPDAMTVTQSNSGPNELPALPPDGGSRSLTVTPPLSSPDATVH
jgi:hypothetical protein